MLAWVLLFSQDPLPQEKAEVLDRLFRQEGLFDPVAARAMRMRGKVVLRTCWGRRETVEASGWQIPAGRFVLDTLQEVDPPLQAVPVDFLKEPVAGPTLRSPDGLFSSGAPSQLIHAAWRRRLGHPAVFPDLKSEEAIQQYRRAVAWATFDFAVNAFMLRDDADALAAAERVVRAGDRYADQARVVVEDLLRRRKAGTFGRAPAPLQTNLRGWSFERRLKFLLDALEDVDARQEGGPGEPDLDGQTILRELVACGEAAVPALLDRLDTDTRLTRTVGYFRDWQPARDLYTVKDVAAVALRAILRLDRDIRLYLQEPLRRTWERGRDLPLPQRMLRTLKDPAADPIETLEAADVLGHPGQERSLNSDSTWRASTSPSTPPPGTAEAILAAMDRHLGSFKGGRGRMAVESPAWVRDRYLASLTEARILPELARRFAASPDGDDRVALAVASHRLGDARPMDAVADELAKDELKLPANDRAEVAGNMPGFFQPGFQALERAVVALGTARTPACEKALAALARPEHPRHAWIRDRLLSCHPGFSPAWFAHPFGLQVLRRALEDVQPTGREIVLDGEQARYLHGSGWSSRDLPEGGPWRAKAAERVCDVAADQILELVAGAPLSHPLFEDAEARLLALREWWDAAAGFRRWTPEELESADLPLGRIRYARQGR